MCVLNISVVYTILGSTKIGEFTDKSEIKRKISGQHL